MKTIHEKDYTYLGTEGQWHVFESKPKPNFYPERLLEYAARMVMLNGESRFFDPIQSNEEENFL